MRPAYLAILGGAHRQPRSDKLGLDFGFTGHRQRVRISEDCWGALSAAAPW